MLRKEAERAREREKEGETLTALVSIRKCWGGWKVLITRTKNKYISFSLFTRITFPLLVLSVLKLPHLPSENETEIARINRKRAAVALIIMQETSFTSGITDQTSDFLWFFDFIIFVIFIVHELNWLIKLLSVNEFLNLKGRPIGY